MSEVGHILVVDDDPEIGRTIDAYLSEEGYRVSVATSGAQMREIFKRQTVDLVILDLLVPGEIGLEIARALRAESNIGIIMLTGRVDVVDSIVGLEMGADDYVAKPANLRELLARVRSVLRRKDMKGTECSADSNQVASRDLTNIESGYSGQKNGDAGNTIGKLTRRESEVLALLINGHSNKEIARKIGVKEVTVAFHLKGVFKKLGVSNRTQAAAIVLREGWQPPDVARTSS